MDGSLLYGQCLGQLHALTYPLLSATCATQTVSQARNEYAFKPYLPFFHAMYGHLLTLNTTLELGKVIKTVDK